MVKTARRHKLAFLLLAATCTASLGASPADGNASDASCTNVEYSHGLTYLLPPKYDAGFTHYDYVNPNAPKAGVLRLPQMGTYDNYNVILEKGRLAAGFSIGGGLVYD